MEINLQKEIQCEICNGSGCKQGTKKNICSTCNGQGQVRRSRSMGFASFVTVEPCSTCKGQGSIIQTPCSECRGNGKKKGTKKYHLIFHQVWILVTILFQKKGMKCLEG